MLSPPWIYANFETNFPESPAGKDAREGSLQQAAIQAFVFGEPVGYTPPKLYSYSRIFVELLHRVESAHSALIGRIVGHRFLTPFVLGAMMVGVEQPYK